VTGIEQALNLKVIKGVSRLATMVYPRSYMPGNYEIKGMCETQQSYHELSFFIRTHQRAIAEAPATDRFARVRSGNTSGYARLLRLAIPSEGIYVRGWVEKFGVINKGVFDPAPTYNFSFFIVHDLFSKDIGISNMLKYYQEGSDEAFFDRTATNPEEFNTGADATPVEDIHDPPTIVERFPPPQD